MSTAEDNILALTIPFMIMFVGAMWAIVVSRHYQHKETMEYAKQGLYPPHKPRRFKMTEALEGGIVTLFVGTGLLLGLSTIGIFTGNLIGPWLIPGIVAIFVGLGLCVIGYLNGSNEAMMHDWQEPIPPQKQAAYLEIEE